MLNKFKYITQISLSTNEKLMHKTKHASNIKKNMGYLFKTVIYNTISKILTKCDCPSNKGILQVRAPVSNPTDSENLKFLIFLTLLK